MQGTGRASTRRRPLLIGHRGAPREHPENSLAAFERALELGADGLELDVHVTADGVPVVHHDGSLTPGGSALVALTLEQLGQRARDAGKDVPTLADVLDLVGDRADLYIELKGRAIEHVVVSALRGSPARSRCALHSFDHRATARARALDATLPGGILLMSYLVDTHAALRGADARDLWMWWEMIDAELVETVHRCGGRVIAWTVNAGEAAVALSALGVDAICTDDLPAVRLSLGAVTSG